MTKLKRPMPPSISCPTVPREPNIPEYIVKTDTFWTMPRNMDGKPVRLVDCLKDLPEAVNIDDLCFLGVSSYHGTQYSIVKQTTLKNAKFEPAKEKYIADLAAYETNLITWKQLQKEYEVALAEYDKQAAIARLEEEKKRIQSLLLKITDKGEPANAALVKEKPKRGRPKKAKVGE